MSLPEINKVREQFQSGLWPQFLEQIEITGLRGWTGQSVAFRFPVTAIVGENGSGKSTVLKVAAAAYDPTTKYGYYPSDFFLSTHWDDFQDVILRYRIKRGDDTTNFSIRKPTKRWSFPKKRHDRHVYWFDVARTLPLDATAGYAKVARLAAGESHTEAISEDFRARLSHVLGREYSNARFASPDVSEKRQVGILERSFGEISQFHQGAGEDTTLDLFRAIQEVPVNSLLVIDEVEASLHPRAQRRLTQFLIQFARLRRVQVVVSTHSPYVLEELPPEARVLLIPTATGPSVVYGASPEFALSRLDDVVHPEATLYVEDRIASVWLREILAQDADGGDLLARIRISPVGPANVVRMMGELAASDRLEQKGLGVLDADMEEAAGCILLPGGNAPERVVFEGLRDKSWPKLSERFGIGAGDLLTYLEDAILDADHHKWPSLVGDRVIKSATSVWEIMATEWCRACLEDQERERITSTVRGLLDVAG